MAQGVGIPPLPMPGEKFDSRRAEETNLAIEQALTDLSAQLQNINELTPASLAELVEGLTPDASPDDTDLVVVANGDGTLNTVEVGDLASDPPPSFPLTAPVARWIRLGAMRLATVVSGGTIALGFGAARFYPFMVSRPIASGTITVLRTAGAGISANVKMALYTTDSATGLPATQLFAGSNSATLAVTDLVPGVVYWAALGVLSSSVTWAGLTTAESIAPFGREGAESATGEEHNSFQITFGTDLPSPFSGSITYAEATIPAFFLEDPS